MKSKKILALLLAAAMTAGLIACGNNVDEADNKSSEVKEESKTSESASTPVSEEKEEIDLSYPIKDAQGLSIFSIGLSLPDDQIDWKNVPFWQGLQENTGVTLDVQFPVAGVEWDQAFNLLLTDEVLPDIIFKYTSASECEQLLEDGVIYDLTEYLPTYAPDYWAFLNDPTYASVKNEITTTSGKIATFMGARENLYGVCYAGPVVRKDWLEECGLDEPVTVADWEEMLVAFKDKYDAKFAFAPYYFSQTRAIASGFDAFGGIAEANFYVDDGEIKLAQEQSEWYDMMVTLNKWYEMGLIDPDILSLDNDIIRSKVLNNEIGAAVTAMSQITNWAADAEAENTGAEWMGAGYLRTAEGEPTSMILATASLNLGYGALITTSCPEEKLIEALRFLNYAYTEEGHMYWNFGTEGVSYIIGEDGYPEFTDIVKNNSNGLGTGVSNYSGTTVAGPAVQDSDMVRAKNNKVAGDAVYKWIENTAAQEYCLPSIALDADANTEFNDIFNSLSTMIGEVAAKFMIGEEPLENFSTFIDDLHEMGLDRALEILQTAYDAQYK